MTSRAGDHALPAKPDPEVPSPMSAHDFPADLLRAVLHRLPPANVARAACVCRLWRAVASDRAVLEAAFRAPWGVRRVLGDPATRAFWRAASLARVVRVTVADIDVEHVGVGVRQRTASSAWPSSPAAASHPLWWRTRTDKGPVVENIRGFSVKCKKRFVF
ncbi:F-box domain-containing protein [Hordeum vulgare]|nr:F-box domain-containing protein [Hordeum vulgare]